MHVVDLIWFDKDATRFEIICTLRQIILQGFTLNFQIAKGHTISLQ